MARKQKSSGQQQDPFRKALALSGLLHLIVIVFFSVSMPFLRESPQTPERVNVRLVDADKVTERAKAPAAGAPDNSDDASEPRTQPEPERPPKQMKAVKPPQAPKVDMSKPPQLQQLEHTSAAKPVPEPVPRKPAPPKPESDKKEDEQQQQQKKAQDKQDTKKADKQFQSVLKNLAEPDPVRDRQDQEKKNKPDKGGNNDNAGQARQQSLANRAKQVTMSEKQALLQQLSQCWNVPVGVKDAEDLVISLRLHMNPDRTVQQVELLDKTRYDNNPQFRAAADSALRAVQNPKCSPLKLPPEKYDQWKVITIHFDPQEML